jgi:hypothetical protein
MLILIEISFLIFGIFFDKNGLLITALILSSLWILTTLFVMSQKIEVSKFIFFWRIICFALSIIYLVI